MIPIEQLEFMIKSARSCHGTSSPHNFVPFEFKIRESYRFAPSFDEHNPPKDWAGRTFQAVAKSGSEKSVWFSALESVFLPIAKGRASFSQWINRGYCIPIQHVMLPPYEHADEVLTAEEVGQLRHENNELKNELGQLKASTNTHWEPHCPKCSKKMIKKTNWSYIDFWACAHWRCDGTRDIDWVAQLETRCTELEKDKIELHDLWAKKLEDAHPRLTVELADRRKELCMLRACRDQDETAFEELSIENIELAGKYVNQQDKNKQLKIRIAELECVVSNLTNSMTDSQFLEVLEEEEARELIPDERLEIEEIKTRERMHRVAQGSNQNIATSSFKWSTLQTLIRWGSVATAASIFFLS